jgi:predicted anti-sigma-YlaC factor YlaD
MIDCATIRDLLPLYVDDVVSKESRALISGHIAGCEECKKEYEKMRNGMESLKLNADNSVDNAEIGAFKTMKRKIYKGHIIAAIISALIVVALVATVEIRIVGAEAVGMDLSLLIGIAAIAMIINTIFGLYNLRITSRVKTLSKTLFTVILLVNILNTGNCLIHLLVNKMIGAYKKS